MSLYEKVKEVYADDVWLSESVKALEIKNQSLAYDVQKLKKMIGTFGKNIPSIQAEAAKDAIYALFEVGNCPQSENGAGDGYIECGDALEFADKYAEQILQGGASVTNEELKGLVSL